MMNKDTSQVDFLFKMTKEELEAYRQAEAEKVIQAARPENQLKMRALQAKCNGIAAKGHWTPMQRADAVNKLMMDSLRNLNENLKPFREMIKK